MGNKSMKKTVIALTLLAANIMPLTTYADMQVKDISACYVENGVWKEVPTVCSYQDGLLDGWYEENGNTYYITNGNATSSLQMIDGRS